VITCEAYCQHGKHTIKNEKPFEHCDICQGVVEQSFYVPNTEPFLMSDWDA